MCVRVCVCVCVCKQGEGQGERERISSRHHTVCGSRLRAQAYDPEIMTLAEIKSQTFNQLSHPGATNIKIFK